MCNVIAAYLTSQCQLFLHRLYVASFVFSIDKLMVIVLMIFPPWHEVCVNFMPLVDWRQALNILQLKRLDVPQVLC